MIGIIIGVASLTVVICVGQGTRERVMALVARHGLDTLMIRPGSGKESGTQGGGRSLVSLTEDDTHAIEASVGNVKQVAPVQSQNRRGPGRLASAGRWVPSDAISPCSLLLNLF